MSSYLSYFSRDPSSSFAYEIGAEIPGLNSSQSIWALHEGKLKKAPHTKVTIFVYDVKVYLFFVKFVIFKFCLFQAGTDISTEVAKKALKRMKTLRHPSVVTYIDSVESEKFIYIATEVVTPLSAFLDNIADRHGL